MSVPHLTPRLQLIAEQVKALKSDDFYVAADIGTDHAKLPVFLVKTGICSFVYAGDLRSGPLESAGKTVSFYGCTEEQIVLLCSDGLKEIPQNYHTVIIAGMGGELIVKILSETSCPENTAFVLSPMTAAEDLRRYLFENRFSILSEKIAMEGERVYPVLTAKKTGFDKDYDDCDCYLSPALLMNRQDPGVIRYIKKQMAAKDKIINGKKTAGLFDEEYAAAAVLRERFLHILEEIGE